MSPLRIALIRARYNPFGGAERFVTNALSALQSSRVQLTILTRSWQAQPGVDTLVVNPFYLGSVWRDWSFARGVCRALRSEKFDLVQSHERLACCDVYRAGDGVHREWLHQRCRGKNFRERLTITMNPYHRYVLQAERALFQSNRLRAVICNSEMVKNEIRHHFSLSEPKCRVIFNGVDSERFSPRLRETHRNGFRDKLGIPRDVTVYLLVGSGFERKGVGTFLRALSALPADCHGVIVGRDKRQRHYEKLATTLGLTQRAHFTGGLTDAGPAYGAADAFVLPTLYDPFPNAVLEAMASGLPVITSTKSGAAELIDHGANGYQCDALDEPKLAQLMTRLRDPKRRAAMGEAGRQTVLPLTFEAMSSRLLALYEELLDHA